MKLLVLVLSTVALVASKTVTTQVAIDLENNTAYDYLEKVGLPLANKIREDEALSATVKRNVPVFRNAVDPSYKIIDGNVARLGDIPYQAGIIADFRGGQSVCGGSLISDKRVVTAAHCWQDGKNQAVKFTVILGSVKLYSGGTRLETSQVTTHSNWNPRILQNDIAMVYLPAAVKFSNIIQPIALPSGADLQQSFVGESVVASGFGRTGDGGAGNITLYQGLNYAKLQVITNEQCNPVYGNIIPSIICTKGANIKSTCFGDSGGPLALTRNDKRILIGITSFVPKIGCEKGLPTGYTRVTYFIDWIKKLL